MTTTSHQGHFVLSRPQVAKTTSPESTALTLSSRRRLEVNVTATFIETAITTLEIWRRESDNVLRMNRGENAPFRVRNRTGYPIRIWSETDDKRASPQSEYISDGQEIPWRFDDWRSMREVGERSHSRCSYPLIDIIRTLPRRATTHLVSRLREHRGNAFDMFPLTARGSTSTRFALSSTRSHIASPVK
jgi:hypothetical protein